MNQSTVLEKLSSDFGVMGIMLTIFILAIVFLSRFIIGVINQDKKENKEMYNRLDEKFTKYMEEDRKKMHSIIEDNTKALNNFNK